MDLRSIKPALKTLIGNLTGLTTVWLDEPQPFIPPTVQAYARLSITAISGLGSDEYRQIDHTAENPPPANGQELTAEIQGNRTFTLTVRVESQIQTDGGSADVYLEKVRNGLWYASTAEALHAVNLSWADVLSTVTVNEVRDQRTWSIGTLDLKMNHRLSYPDPVANGYIASVDLIAALRP